MRNLVFFLNSERFQDNYTKENQARLNCYSVYIFGLVPLILIKAVENIRDYHFEFFVFLYVLTRKL
jgi:hypothetical protein